jgi:mono/diheme cytochrome c family protein
VTGDRLARLGLLALVPVALGACDWFTNFTRQPKIDPWEIATMTDTARRDSIPPRGNPQGSVPMLGSAIPDWVVSYAGLPLTVDSLSGLPNPTPPNDTSLANGRMLYQINCAVCHGDAGDGRGPMVTRPGYNFPPITLITGTALTRSDGYIYGMIRNGRGLMPTYNRIEHMDRWDVVNYVRGLQGRLGRTVPTGPVGQPGEGGDKVPGATLTAPTRPAPHRPRAFGPPATGGGSPPTGGRAGGPL